MRTISPQNDKNRAGRALLMGWRYTSAAASHAFKK